jgi:tRNA (guanine10-N2)-dimethyltransferase
MQSLCILGRQPAIGMAELESLYGSSVVTPVSNVAALIDVDPCLLAFDRLGGSIKFCKVLTTLPTTKWEDVEKFLIEVSPGHAKDMAGGKMNIGLSLYGWKLDPRRLMRTALSLKKAIKVVGKSVRIVPNKELSLSSAQVIYNKLTGPNGWELVFIMDEGQTIVAQTVKEQDINSYSFRDRDRPKRDTRVGMLPPKLAQIIINLATGELPKDKLQSICDIPEGQTIPRPNFDELILDPFCGTGVILQEALLMGYKVNGSDIDERMIDYSSTNLKWLETRFSVENSDSTILEIGDATSFTWDRTPKFIASEAYLGQAFTSQPTDGEIIQNVSTTNLIIKKSLRNIAQQIPSGTRLCIAVPAYHDSRGNFRHLPFIDSIEELGYNRISFKHLSNSELIYFREQQIVARELLVITRK